MKKIKKISEIRIIILIIVTLVLLSGCNTKKDNKGADISDDTASLSNEELEELEESYETTSTEDIEKIIISESPSSEDSEPSKEPELTKEAEPSNEPEDSVSEIDKEDEIMLVIDEPFGITYTYNGIDYGTLEKVSYYSTTAQRDTFVNVLLPAEYSKESKYPVLYILHGYWGNEDSMLDAGDSSLKIQQIVGNLVSKGEAEKMILVFPYIYTSKDQATVTAMDPENSLNYDNFINDLVTDLMPFIESNYAAATGRENTAITGFSMGGRESLFIGFTRLDLFGYIGAVCPAPGVTPGEDLYSHPGQMQESELSVKDADTTPFLVMISAAYNDSSVGDNPKKYHEILTQNNVEHIWNYLPGGDHGGRSIRPHIYNFVRMIFKAN